MTITLRNLRRNPGFASIALVTIALGIGGTAAIFGVMNAVLKTVRRDGQSAVRRTAGRGVDRLAAYVKKLPKEAIVEPLKKAGKGRG